MSETPFSVFPGDKLTIKSWADEDRPREKMLLKGKQSLSDAELIAILIGSGNTEDSAVELSKKILGRVNNDLFELGKLSVKELMKFKGIGEAKAISIVAALELGRRRKDKEKASLTKISSSADAAEIMHPLLEDIDHEQFWIILLNRAHAVTNKICVSTGGVAGTVADPKIIFKHALEHSASGLILCHNHPSGNRTPSDSDIQLTKKIKSGAELLDISVLDHIIIAAKAYYSFADEGKL